MSKMNRRSASAYEACKIRADYLKDFRDTNHTEQAPHQYVDDDALEKYIKQVQQYLLDPFGVVTDVSVLPKPAAEKPTPDSEEVKAETTSMPTPDQEETDVELSPVAPRPNTEVSMQALTERLSAIVNETLANLPETLSSSPATRTASPSLSTSSVSTSTPKALKFSDWTVVDEKGDADDINTSQLG